VWHILRFGGGEAAGACNGFLALGFCPRRVSKAPVVVALFAFFNFFKIFEKSEKINFYDFRRKNIF